MNSTKKEKPKKQRADKYETKLGLEATFERVIEIAMSGNPKSKKG